MSSTPISLDPKRLIELLSQQRTLYLRLQDLSEQQRTLIAEQKPEQLLNILRDRQALVAESAKINTELAPFRKNWKQVYDALPTQLRDSAAALLNDINGMLRLILKEDQQDSALLSARKQAVAKDMRGVASAQSVNRAYAAGADRRATQEVSG